MKRLLLAALFVPSIATAGDISKELRNIDSTLSGMRHDAEIARIREGGEGGYVYLPEPTINIRGYNVKESFVAPHMAAGYKHCLTLVMPVLQQLSPEEAVQSLENAAPALRDCAQVKALALATEQLARTLK